MSRTHRIYNSYARFGRFFPKSQYGTQEGHEGHIVFNLPPKTYPAGIPLLDHRWAPYGERCMGNCRGCRLGNPKHAQRQHKHTSRHKILKFVQEVVA